MSTEPDLPTAHENEHDRYQDRLGRGAMLADTPLDTPADSAGKLRTEIFSCGPHRQGSRNVAHLLMVREISAPLTMKATQETSYLLLLTVTATQRCILLFEWSCGSCACPSTGARRRHGWVIGLR